MEAARIEKLCKDFDIGTGPLRVLFDIDLKLHMGELTMLIGPSGCGKTTLISILSGILSSTSGTINVMDNEITSMTDSQKVFFRRKHIGFIFQQYNLLPSLTAAENAAMPLITAGMSIKNGAIKGKEILETVGMGNEAQKFPRELSGGQQQRVAIARALIHSPDIILCDEPTANLDGKNGQAIMELLRQIANDANRAVLVVSHDPRTYHFSDRIVEMADGHIIKDLPTKDFLKTQTHDLYHQ